MSKLQDLSFEAPTAALPVAKARAGSQLVRAVMRIGRAVKLAGAMSFFVLALAVSALAEPARYLLDPDASSVGFTYTLSGQESKGTMPVTQAELVLDFEQVSRSSAHVTLSAARARTGLVFAAQALKDASVLNTERYPDIKFVSRKIVASGNGARIDGNVTIRGVTRPLTLNAQIFRRQGSEAGERSQLSVLMTGEIDRREFGASGYANLVDPTVSLRILARVDRVGS